MTETAERKLMSAGAPRACVISSGQPKFTVYLLRFCILLGHNQYMYTYIHNIAHVFQLFSEFAINLFLTFNINIDLTEITFCMNN